MKKKLQLLFVLVISFALATVGLVACGDSPAEPNEAPELEQDIEEAEEGEEASDEPADTLEALLAAVQGESSASAAYEAFAAAAKEEGYEGIARLFQATADAEAKHAEDEWALALELGATERPVADTPEVGTIEENLQAAIDGETYEYTVMYPAFIAIAQAEGLDEVAQLFTLVSAGEAVHAATFTYALSKIDDIEHLDSFFAEIFRCVDCGDIQTERPDECKICAASGDTYVAYN
ncbi:MAG: rubrerythrin family protein [Coriobacteriia bacterium]|nr:rubrerythrin family protein [Coriobacteriia bacterium]